MTDKLDSYGRSSYIESFISGGLKFYAYVVRTPEHAHEICKLKGITLNYNNFLIVNFNSIKKLMMEKERQEQEEEKEEEETTETALNIRFNAIRRTAFS